MPLPIINFVLEARVTLSDALTVCRVTAIPYSGTSIRPDEKQRDSLSKTVRAESKCLMIKKYKKIFEKRH